MTAETGAEKTTGGEDSDAAGPACGPPGDLDESRVSPIRMWVGAEDPEPVERQEAEIFLGAVLRCCDEREEGLDVVGGELGDVALGRWRRARESEAEGGWPEAEFNRLPGNGVAHFRLCFRMGVPDGFSFRRPAGGLVTDYRRGIQKCDAGNMTFQFRLPGIAGSACLEAEIERVLQYSLRNKISPHQMFLVGCDRGVLADVGPAVKAMLVGSRLNHLMKSFIPRWRLSCSSLRVQSRECR